MLFTSRKRGTLRVTVARNGSPVLSSNSSVWTLELSCAFSFCIRVCLSCLAFHSNAASADLRPLFPRQDHEFVCVSCHPAGLRTNAAAEAWVARRDAGLLTNAAQHAFPNAMPQLRCNVAERRSPTGCTRVPAVHATVTSPPQRLSRASCAHSRLVTSSSQTSHELPTHRLEFSLICGQGKRRRSAPGCLLSDKGSSEGHVAH